MNPVSARLLAQQLISPQFSSPHDVVAWMGAVQAQDYKMMRWAVEMRCKKPSAAAFERDFNSGAIVRTHLLRTTWQLVAGEDLGWMLDLCRTPALRGLHGWMKSNGVIIPAAEQDRVRQVFVDVLSAKKSAGKEDFAAALAERDLAMDDQRLSFHILLQEFSGVLCSGDLRARQCTYALTSGKLPQTQALSREEALALLARKYFRSHGPATLEDFVWWSGLNIGQCRQGMAALGGDLVRERWKQYTFYRLRDSRIRGFRSGCVHLLPSYDEYLIGYKSRQVALHPDHRHRAHDQKGTFWPVILQDGEVVGNWSSAGGRLRTEVFRPDVVLSTEGFEREKQRYGRFLCSPHF